jgi:cell wall-associated NlpC family hydrolase
MAPRASGLWGVGLMAGLFGLAAGAADDRAGYRSPYRVEFTHPERELIGDVLAGHRAAPANTSEVPANLWYSHAVKEKWGSWGPPRRTLPAPPGVAEWPAAKKRERVVAVALRYVGITYQHHHLPDWDPPAGWPWEKVGCGHNGKGVDCSNFTSFVYDVALGLHPNSEVHKQSEQLEIPTLGGPHRAERIDRPASYEGFEQTLKTGDLLYIKGSPTGHVTHVVLWVGKVGRSPDGVPLVLDSTGSEHTDANGAKIPDGPHLRPFGRESWYFKSASHAHRLVRGE